MKTDNEKNLFDDLYFFIESLGLYVINFFKKLTYIIIICPIVFFIAYLKKAFFLIKNFLCNLSFDILKEKKAFNNDIKIAREIYKKNKKADIDKKENSLNLLVKFFKSALKNHKPFLKHSLNIVLPTVSIIILFIIFQYNSNLDFALKVKYNGVYIGNIESEQVFRDAEETVKERLALGGQKYNSKTISKPEYEIAIVRPNEISDSNDICQGIIENSNSNLITACGVYIDEKFLCSVKNESDASYVFKNLINEYCQKHNIDQENSNYIVDLVEDVKYIQGLYMENTIMTSEEISEYISNHKKSESSTYTFSYGDTVDSIAKKYNLTKEQFYALNPSIQSKDVVSYGQKLNVIKNIPYINISVSKTITKTEAVNFNIQEIKTNALFTGARKVVTEGKTGKKRVTKLITYVNGVKITEKEIKSVVTEEPKEEIVYVGTKPVPSYVQLTGVFQGAFIWPTIGADYVTSGFGYRMLYNELNFHRGLDISGAAALGKPIIASAPGIVEQVTAGNTGYGYSVLINHGNGIKTRYAHCLKDSIIVNVGDTVEQGQMIAQIGSTGNSTGPHLHFEIIYNGAYTNPLEYLTR